MNTSEVKNIWESVKKELQRTIPEHIFVWISHLEAISYEGNQFTLVSGESFGIDHLKRTQYKNITEAFNKILQKEIIVNLEYDENLAKQIKKEKQKLEKKLKK